MSQLPSVGEADLFNVGCCCPHSDTECHLIAIWKRGNSTCPVCTVPRGQVMSGPGPRREGDFAGTGLKFSFRQGDI